MMSEGNECVLFRNDKVMGLIYRQGLRKTLRVNSLTGCAINMFINSKLSIFHNKV